MLFLRRKKIKDFQQVSIQNMQFKFYRR